MRSLRIRQKCDRVTRQGSFAGPTGHTHEQGVVGEVQHAVDRTQAAKRAVLLSQFSGPKRDAHQHRAFTIDLAMRATAHVPEAIRAAGHDAIVASANGAIGAEEYGKRADDHGRIAPASVEVDAQQAILWVK